jgi:Sec-independent protein secretion pathway component TatC
MIIGVGVLFEFPLLVVGLVAVGCFGPAITPLPAHAISGFLVAVPSSPPPPISVTFLVLAVPMWLLYEGAIIVSGMIERRRAEA